MARSPLHAPEEDHGPVVLPPAGSLALRVAVGNPFRAPGRTMVEVEPSGAVAIVTVYRTDAVRDLGRVERLRAETLIDAATTALLSFDPPRWTPPVPDEAMYLIEVRDGDESVAGAFIPERMVEADAALSCLLHALCDLVDEQAPDRHYLAGAVVG